MNVLLINPPAQQIVEKHDKPDHPQIGLSYLASFMLSKNMPVKIIDAKLEGLDINACIKRISNHDFDILGITSFTHDIIMADKLAKKIKEQYPDKKVILGGVHITALPKKTLEDFDYFDIGIYGEGEITLFEVIDAIRNSKSLDKIKGICYRKENEVKVNPPREILENLDSLPMPAWHLFPKCKHYQIMSSRGCPYNCIFCMSPYGRKKVRERSPEEVIKELDLVINKYKPKLYTFNDETFAFNLKRAHKLLDIMIEKKYFKKTKFDASLRANHVNLELLKKMKKAGFVVIDYGIESGNAEILKIIKKGVTLEQTERAIKLTKKAGIRADANYIIGHPFETKKTAMDTINYAVKLNAGKNAIGLMVPYPGTEVAEMAKRGYGGYRLLSTNWKDFNKQLGNALELKTLSRKEMERLQLWGYLKIYLWNFRFIGLTKFIWENKKAGIAVIKKYFSYYKNDKK